MGKMAIEVTPIKGTIDLDGTHHQQHHLRGEDRISVSRQITNDHIHQEIEWKVYHATGTFKDHTVVVIIVGEMTDLSSLGKKIIDQHGWWNKKTTKDEKMGITLITMATGRS